MKANAMNSSALSQAVSPAISGGTLERQAYESVKHRIMTRELRPGQQVTDSQIAAELNISRTPVRDALRHLEHEGFLISSAGKGWRVYSLNLGDIREIFEIKIVLEGILARQAAACTDPAKRERLQGVLCRMKEAAQNDDREAWREADMELHRLLFAMCTNERASRIIQDLNDQWYRVRTGMVAIEGRMKRSNEEHEAFVESILSGDGENAERMMRLHLTRLREELENVLVNLVLPFAHDGI